MESPGTPGVNMIIHINGKNYEVEPGIPIIVDNATWVICPECLKLVRLNKPFLGGLHFCE